jgi:hypothetical protein
MRIATQVAERKREKPEQYCPVPRCLYRTNGRPCPRHPATLYRHETPKTQM